MNEHAMATVRHPGTSGHESSVLRLPEPGAVQSVGLWVFIGVASSLFGLFLSAYVMRLAEADASSIVMPWQLALSTACLIAGSMLMQRAAVQTRSGNDGRWPLRAGGACALAFIAVQWWAWQVLLGQRVSLQGNPAGSFFYLLTAVHATHVMGGLAAWATALRAVTAGSAAARNESWRVVLCARYWHFLLLVWVLLWAAFVVITPDVAARLCGTR